MRKHTWMRTLRRPGSTYAGFTRLSRPSVHTQISRISKTSSCRPKNNAERFSGWAKCVSKIPSKFSKTVNLTWWSMWKIKNNIHEHWAFKDKLVQINSLILPLLHKYVNMCVMYVHIIHRLCYKNYKLSVYLNQSHQQQGVY